MKLRDYQERAVDVIRSAFSKHRSVCLALQVGGGKTVIACEIMRRSIARGKRVMFVVHRVELVEQARERLALFEIESGVIKAGYRERRDRLVQVACIPTLVRREYPPADVVIFDEAHHGVSASWLSVLTHYRSAGAFILGITATPLRLDGKPLGSAFETIVEPVTTQELIQRGFLMEPRVFAPPTCDLSDVKIRGGDYALPEVASRMSKLTGSITGNWLRYCRGRPTLAFAVNVAHSREIESALAAVGARVAHIDGGTGKVERARANKRLRSGDLDVVTQCQLWTEGLDIPELEALIVARPTKSLSLHRQIIGRVMRPALGKSDAIVFDHAGNHHEHGFVTEPIEWSLDAKPKRISTALPVATCPECFACFPPGAAICPGCGSPLKDSATADRPAPAVDNPGELVEINMVPTRDEREIAYNRMVQSASCAGRKLGSARAIYKRNYGVWPKHPEVEKGYVCPGHHWERWESEKFSYVRCSFCYERGTSTLLNAQRAAGAFERD
jgi:superfamily II DNA or RNA helicase